MRTFRLSCIACFSFLFLFSVLNPMQASAGDSSSIGVSLVANATALSVPAVDVAQAVEPSAISKFMVALPDWLQLLSLIISACAGLAALTPTPKDDSALLVLRKIVDFLALNFGGAKNASANKNPRDIS